MKFCILIFFTCQLFLFISSKAYSIEEVFNFINNLTETEDNLNKIIDSLSDTLNKTYTYNEIYKNPPQPKFDENYYTKINIQEKLKSINTKNANVYEFYREIKKVLDSLKDHHLIFGGEMILNYLNFLEPIRYDIKKIDNKYRMFAQEISFTDFFKNFKNNETIFDIIKKNRDTPIKSINGQDPFNFITNFGGVFKKLKSPQASFRYKFINHNLKSLADYPLTIDELTNFTVIYENGDNFTTDYIIYTTKILEETDFIKENKFFDFNSKKSEIIDYTINMDNSLLKSSIFLNDINNNLSKDENQKDLKIEEEKINYSLGSIDWNYDSDSSIFCKVDETKKVNVYTLSNFNIKESSRYIKAVKSCVELFDNNDYPIIFINIFNQGGLIYMAQLVLELLSPSIALNIYGAFRDSDIFKDNKIFNDEILSSFSDSKNCEVLNYEKLINKTNKINYGNQIEDTLSDVVIFNGKKFKKEVEPIKKKLKNPRKPTDIIVFTDGYTFSAGAIMIKFLQYYGGAITAGYFPYPNLDDIPYDSGSSASALFSYKILQSFNIEEYKKLEDLNLYLSVPGAQIFYNKNNFSRPLEYEVTPVDEIVEIYPKYENTYNILNDEGYESFINESLKIFEKYKTKCNPNNNKLLLLTSDCDGKFRNNYTHGGYKCNENGTWSQECVPSYCDIGFIFDHTKHKCVIDICSDSKPEYDPDPENETEHYSDSESGSNEESQHKSEEVSIFSFKNTIFLILFIVFCLIIISLIIIVIVCIKIKRGNINKEINSIDDMNLDEKMNTH